MITKNEETQTDLPELENYISERRYNRLKKAYDDGKIYVNDLRNHNEQLNPNKRS